MLGNGDGGSCGCVWTRNPLSNPGAMHLLGLEVQTGLVSAEAERTPPQTRTWRRKGGIGERRGQGASDEGRDGGTKGGRKKKLGREGGPPLVPALQRRGARRRRAAGREIPLARVGRLKKSGGGGGGKTTARAARAGPAGTVATCGTDGAGTGDAVRDRGGIGGGRATTPLRRWSARADQHRRLVPR